MADTADSEVGPVSAAEKSGGCAVCGWRGVGADCMMAVVVLL